MAGDGIGSDGEPADADELGAEDAVPATIATGPSMVTLISAPQTASSSPADSARTPVS